ncbi:hypothetical protein KFL_002810050 [Klebsormidium nitens]|uniref:DUF1772 domain-containing protein n=1 Tax=Klebsormidium nitens TaxID=105231 RepID=A0A1Y1IC31_KLENI|nr:hypothetical protein KFL_002810050 [Klebsormidium nitens]|eukprot:GAQ86297.1 hypothetical protein KFL_002810050 [Klebsormidium nitens]
MHALQIKAKLATGQFAGAQLATSATSKRRRKDALSTCGDDKRSQHFIPYGCRRCRSWPFWRHGLFAGAALFALQIVAILAAGLFAGAALFVSVVQRPVMERLPTNQALSYWRTNFDAARLMQIALALIGSAAAALAAAAGGGRVWWFAGGLLATVIPYTAVVIFPTIRRLNDDKLDPTSKEAKALLRRWYELHAFRTVVSVSAFGVMVAAR